MLSFEEVRANYACGYLESATVENLWHDDHVDDRESAKNNSSVKSSQTDHCMNNTKYNIDSVQSSQEGARTLPQGKPTIVSTVTSNSPPFFFLLFNKQGAD